MINIENDDIVEKIKGTGRTFKATIKAGDTVFTEIKSLKQTFPFASNNKISIGETPSSFIEAEIRDCRLPLQGYELEVKLSIDDYEIPLGFFTIEEPGKVDGNGTQKIVAYDRMSQTSKFTYTALGETLIGTAISNAFSICGYDVDLSEIKRFAINDESIDGVDCRTAIGYFAGFLGGNFVACADGVFRLVKYKKVLRSDNYISIDSLDTLDFSSNTVSVDYIFCTIGENTSIDTGTGKHGINTVNPLFTEQDTEVLSNILRNLKGGTGINYYPAKFKQLNGDPRIEVGDTLLVQHRNILTGEIEEGYVPVMSLVREFDGGLSVSIEAYEPEEEFYISTTDQIKLLQSANKNTTKRTEVVAELNEAISNALGLYKTEITGAGGDVKIYYHNASTLSNSTYIFTMNAEGFAFATGENAWNGGNPVWQNGITKDGNAIFNYLFAEKISANLIEAGIIKSLTGNTEFNLNTGTITHKRETDEYIDNVYVDNGQTTIERIYTKQDITEYTYIRSNGITCHKYTTSTGSLLETRRFTPSLTITDTIQLAEPLKVGYGGTGADNIIDAQKNLGLENGATRKVWFLKDTDTASGSLNIKDDAMGDGYVPSLLVLKLWNGTYFGTSSNLAYCNKGAFGTLATKEFSDLDSRYFRRYGLNEINIDNTNGCWTCDISEQGHGTIPEPWINVTQTSSGHFFSQIAVKCDNDGNAERKTRAMWVRNKYVSSAWSQWTGIQLL